jgi:hypothetical protein
VYYHHHWQSSPFCVIAFLRRSCQICLEFIHPVFTSLDFATAFFYRSRWSALHPIPNLEDQVSIFMSPGDRVAQLYAQAPGSLFVVFYDSQGYGKGILTCLHMGLVYYVVPIYVFICSDINWLVLATLSWTQRNWGPLDYQDSVFFFCCWSKCCIEAIF